MRVIQPAGLSANAGRGPDAGNMPRFTENSRISRTANQNDGVAMQATEKTRMA